MKPTPVTFMAWIILAASLGSILADKPPSASSTTLRIAAAQPQSRLVDWHIPHTDEVLVQVEKSLTELERLVEEAANRHCAAIAFPEDTLGLGNWLAGNPTRARELLGPAVDLMLTRFGAAAARHKIYIVCCNNYVDPSGLMRNTAFLLGRDGQEIGRYHKVCPTIHERVCTPGDQLPVYDTPDLGGVGLLICYDMVFPEPARCLALEGADLIFHSTLGGAAMGDEDISRAAFRTRAVENFVYLVVAQRGNGSMIISPQGKILAEAQGPDSLAVADIDPFGGREGGDAMNHQRDMRARLFRERNPGAFGILTDPNPPVLAKVPATITEEEAVRIAHQVLTVGQDEFTAADALLQAGQTQQAIDAFTRLRTEYRASWIDRVAAQRLAKLQPAAPVSAKKENPAGLAAQFPGDIGIENHPKVIFVETFEEPSLETMQKRWETVGHPEIMSFDADIPAGSQGRQSLLVTHVGGQGNGGQLYRRIPPGYDRVFARFYVKFNPDCAPVHHFGTCIGGNNPSTPWPQVKAGQRTDGEKSFWAGIEPFGKSWTWDYYTYWCEMRGSPPRGQTWGNSFIHDPELKVARGSWTCVEIMIKMNDLGESNGEMALWLDGQPVSHLGKNFPKGKWVFDKFIPGADGEGARWNDTTGARENFDTPTGGAPFEGFRWRTTGELNINFVWAYLYITDAPAGHVSKVWFDHIVVATDYIGPIQ